VVGVTTTFNNKSNIQVKERKVNWTTTDDFAFSHGPRKDGTIIMKDVSILTISELKPLMKFNTNIIAQQHTACETKIPDEAHRRPQWTSTLLKIQRLQLKMRYKNKTKLRARIMRQIRKQETKAEKSASRHINMRLRGWSKNNEPVYRPELNHSPTTQEGDEKKESQTKPTSITISKLQTRITISKLQTLCQRMPGQYTQYDILQGYLNEQNTYKKSIMHQCMNALRTEPPNPRKKKGLKLRIKVAVQKPKRRKLNFPTVTVHGTPEEQKDTHEVQTQETEKQKDIDDDLNLYYKVYNRYRPEAGESNAESAVRSTALEAEYNQYLPMKKNTGRENVKDKRKRATKLHHLSPITPPRETLVPSHRFFQLRMLGTSPPCLRLLVVCLDCYVPSFHRSFQTCQYDASYWCRECGVCSQLGFGVSERAAWRNLHSAR
jgi:hypothetical protein